MKHLAERILLFPDSTKIDGDSLKIGEHDLSTLAVSYGTPLYIYHRATMDAAIARYEQVLRASYAGPSALTYAGKAFLCKGLAQWARQQQLWLDCAGEGEIRVAVSGGVAPQNIVAHGCNKSESDLQSALGQAGTIVIDNLAELERLGRLMTLRHPVAPGGALPNFWLRLQPGRAVVTHHAHTQTGQADSKFGMTPSEIVQAAKAARSLDLPLTGLHFHQGSNFRDPAPLVSAIELALDLVKEVRFPELWHFSPGGGWGVAYHEADLPQPDIEAYVRVIARTVTKKCRANHLPLPTLHLEPGRSLVARAGVAIYRVGGSKVRADRTWLLIDGGLADNPRHALYAATYSCLPLHGLARPLDVLTSIAGPYCESGDVLIEDLRMPNIEVGELIAIPVSGAYQLSMSSNYNGARRPAVLWLEKGASRLMMRRESVEELMQRDLSIIVSAR